MVDLGNSATLTPNIEAHKIDDIQFMSAGCSYLHLIFTYLMYIKVEALYGDGIHLTIAHKREWSYGDSR